MTVRTTTTIYCSLALATRLGAVTCGEHELAERGLIGIGHKNFHVYPVDGPNYLVFWKWRVVQPSANKKFLYP